MELIASPGARRVLRGHVYVKHERMYMCICCMYVVVTRATRMSLARGFRARRLAGRTAGFFFDWPK